MTGGIKTGGPRLGVKYRRHVCRDCGWHYRGQTDLCARCQRRWRDYHNRMVRWTDRLLALRFA